MEHKYEIGPFLGRGSFAEVHLARDIRTRRKVALKLVDVGVCLQRRANGNNGVGRPKDEVRSGGNNASDKRLTVQTTSTSNSHQSIMTILQREIAVHSSLSAHPNIVHFIESFCYTSSTHDNNANTNSSVAAELQKESNMMAVVMEHCSRGDLQGYLKRLREERRHCVLQSRVQPSRLGGNSTPHSLLLPEGTFLSNAEIHHALSEVLRGLSFLHSRGIVHRDIKASNVFLSPILSNLRNNGSSGALRSASSPLGGSMEKKESDSCSFTLLQCNLKLGDFGLAVQMKDEDDWYEAQNTLCGTPSCLAPEVAMQTGGGADGSGAKRFFGKDLGENSKDSLLGIGNEVDTLLLQQSNNQQHPSKSSTGYGQPADLWSTGCLLYTLIAGRNPFAIPNPTPQQDAQSSQMVKLQRIQQTMDKVVRGDWSLPPDVCVNPVLEGLLEQLLSGEPRKRGTARSLLAFHPYFRLGVDGAAIGADDESDSHVMTASMPLADREIGRMDLRGKENMSNYNSHYEVDRGYAMMSCSTSQRSCGTASSSSAISLQNEPLIPMERLHRLPPAKYEWKEHADVLSMQSAVRFTVFLLGSEGLVIQKDDVRHGLWMHVTSDGLGVYCGALEAGRRITMPRDSMQSELQLLRSEAYSRAPRNFSSSPTRLCHERLSTLLSPIHNEHRRLYRLAESAVRSIQACTPKVTLYLHTQKQSCELFAKAMLMENGADLEIAFVDGTTIRSVSSTGRLQISRRGSASETEFNINLRRFLKSNTTDLMGALLAPAEGTPKGHILRMHTNHVSIAHSAYLECLEMERVTSTKNVVANGWDRKLWTAM